jgi:hypothetical protein
MSPYPTAQEIRQALVSRVAAYCARTGMSPRALCERAIHDPGFFRKVKQSGNFTVKTYQRLHRYMDDHPRPNLRRRTNGRA